MKKKKWIPFLLLPVLLLLCFFFFTEQMPKHYDFLSEQARQQLYT